jgi:glycosyltransferase involved in cell wall biosynthesis
MNHSSEVLYSVIIPVFNEQDSVVPLARGIVEILEGIGGRFEIIFVDDGSTDETPRHLAGLREEDTRIRTIRLSFNSGQSAALWAGLHAARGDLIITMDGDLQNDPRDIPRLLERLDRYDVATGLRRRRRDPWLKRVSTQIANYVRNVVTMEDIRDSACGFKAFRRRCIDALLPFDGMHRFMPTLFRLRGYRVCEVEIPHHPRLHGTSKYNIRNRLFRGLVDLWGVRWLKKRRLSYRAIEEGP